MFLIRPRIILAVKAQPRKKTINPLLFLIEKVAEHLSSYLFGLVVVVLWILFSKKSINWELIKMLASTIGMVVMTILYILKAWNASKKNSMEKRDRPN